MPFRPAAIPVVTICDARGALIWTNHPDPRFRAGTPIWDCTAEEDRELVKDRVARAAFTNEPQEFEARASNDEMFHVWAWPMQTENMGVCLVGLRLPAELARLTARERDCLRRMAMGCSTLEIAAELDVSASTVHTYMRRAREKLELESIDHLIAFAARHLSPVEKPHILASQELAKLDVHGKVETAANTGFDGDSI